MTRIHIQRKPLIFPRLRDYEITSNYFWHFWHITDHYCFLLTHHRPCWALPQLSQAPHLTSSLKSQGPLGDLVGPWGTPLETWRPPRCSPWWMASTSSVSLPPNVSIISEWLERTRGCSDLSSVVRNWRRRPFSIVFETLCCAAISFDGDDRLNVLRLFLVYVADCD